MIICAAIHGILTGQIAVSWPDDFQAWCARYAPGVRVVKKEYTAGPFPRLNWYKNWRIAKGLANEIEAFIGWKVREHTALGCVEFTSGREQKDSIWLFAHSNGAVIALNTMRRLVASGVHVRGIFLTGAACDSDVVRNGVRPAVEAGQLGRAVSWSSPNDGVVKCDGVWKYLKWPYGDLGRVGWQFGGKPFNTWRIYTLKANGGHSSYFDGAQREETFQMVLNTMKEAEMESIKAKG